MIPSGLLRTGTPLLGFALTACATAQLHTEAQLNEVAIACGLGVSTAFGLLNAADFPFKSALMIGIATLALVAISLYARQLGNDEKLSRYGLALILGGAFGNLIDRAIAGYVVDFVDVYWGEAHFWAFNVADAAITIGAILVLLEMLGLGRHHASRPV